MRYSADENDPGFENFEALGGPIQILCDGERVPHAVTCDTAEGWVDHLKLDDNGALVIGGEGDDRGPVVLRTRGRVEVRQLRPR